VLVLGNEEIGGVDRLDRRNTDRHDKDDDRRMHYYVPPEMTSGAPWPRLPATITSVAGYYPPVQSGRGSERRGQKRDCDPDSHDPAPNLLLKRGCCHFAQVIGVTHDPRSIFPNLLRICASTQWLCGCPLLPERRWHHSPKPRQPRREGSLRPHPRCPLDQTLVGPAAPWSTYLSRFRPLALYRRRLLARGMVVVAGVRRVVRD